MPRGRQCAALVLALSMVGCGDGPIDVDARSVDFGLISAGDAMTCGLSTDGEAYCWGRNASGGLGIGTSGAHRATPAPVAGDLTFEYVDVGAGLNSHDTFDGFACGLTASHEAYCWGHNAYGRLGIGTSEDAPQPRKIADDLAFTTLAVGAHHACGLTTEGRAYCWGWNSAGELGRGLEPSEAAEPQPIASSRVFDRMVANTRGTCARVQDTDDWYCWGSLSAGFHPVLLSAPPLATIDPGSFLHACGVGTSGEGYCWGDNRYGALGTGDKERRSEPTLVVGGHVWSYISAGATSTCGLRTDGVVMCWGTDSNGEAARGVVGGAENTSLEPLPIVGGHAFSQLTSGAATRCGLVASDGAYCWGAGYEGERGDGTFELYGPSPVKVLPPGGG